MDSRRPSKKAGSVSSDPKGSTTPASDRPLLQDRTASAPTVARRRPSSSKAPETVKVTPIVDRSSKASIRDDPFYRPYQSPQSVRLADKSRASHGTHKSTKDVRIPPPKSWEQKVFLPIHYIHYRVLIIRHVTDK